MSADCGKLKILIVSGTPIRVIFQNSFTYVHNAPIMFETTKC